MAWPGHCVLTDFTSPIGRLGIPPWARLIWLERPNTKLDDAEKPVDPRTAGLRFERVLSTFFALSQSGQIQISRGELRNFLWNLNLDSPTLQRLWERLDTRKHGFLDIDDLLHLVGRAHLLYPMVPIDALLYEAAVLIIRPPGQAQQPGTHFDRDMAQTPHGIGCQGACNEHGLSYFVSLLLQLAVPGCLVAFIVLGTEKGQSLGYVAGALYLFYLIHAFCCTKFLSMAGNRITGLDAVCNVMEAPRGDMLNFRWHIQCYHYDTRIRTEQFTDANGNQQTRQVTETVRVDTWSNTYTGIIPCTDHTPNFVPDTTALMTEIDTHLELDFRMSNYLQCYRHWCHANHFDIHHDESRSEWLPSRKTAILAEWVSGVRPCWMRRTCYTLATVLLLSACFRIVVQSRCGRQDYTYFRRCYQIPYRPPDRCHSGAAAFLTGLVAGMEIGEIAQGAVVW
eukprot:NODE_330_length_1660_cov_377.705296.p1 GENE.NODE_330_length_1660_cov_377.705296~~NODE_330_length_1660_cov_377.705296.p1  ORF type:complete len:473 (-),score=89.69 NODE_330_length_1660_cov_377.705296:225-1580(-)